MKKNTEGLQEWWCPTFARTDLHQGRTILKGGDSPNLLLRFSQSSPNGILRGSPVTPPPLEHPLPFKNLQNEIPDFHLSTFWRMEGDLVWIFFSHHEATSLSISWWRQFSTKIMILNLKPQQKRGCFTPKLHHQVISNHIKHASLWSLSRLLCRGRSRLILILEIVGA